MKVRFQSSLLLRVFTTTAMVIVVLFAIMYWFAVPFIQRTVERIEEDHAHTVLDHVYEAVENIYRATDHARVNATLERKRALHDIVAVVESRATWLEQQVREKKMAPAPAKQMLLEEIRHIQYGNNDYVWAADYRSVLVAHPDAALNGADFSARRDLRGNLIVPPMVRIARATGDGYYSYWWRRLGQAQHIEKLSYARHIPFFKLVIGSGVYIDDIEANLALRHSNAIEELRQQLRTTRLAQTGYVYIFDDKSNVIIHPNTNLEGKSLAGMIDPATQQELSPMLIAVADRQEGVRYKWDHPADPGNYVYDKISWVRYSPGFNWYIGSSMYVDELSHSATTLRDRLLVIFLTTLVFSIALVYVFVSRLLAPLQQLSATAQAIEQGNLDVRCPVQRHDEIGVVALAFNGMVDRLRDSIQNLDAKVEERTAKLEHAYTELKKLDQLKSDFLSTVSHELRTPMTSVVGFTKRVQKKLAEVIFPAVAVPVTPKTARTMVQVMGNLDIITHESERLTRLINDVLDSAKLDAGKVEWDFAPLVAAALLERAAAVIAPLATQKGLTMTWQADAALPTFTGDENRLLQVLINLLSNAVKFTEVGHIELSAVCQDNAIRFAVRDSGIGIDAAHQSQVFDKFHQIGDTLTDKPQGSGLGLSICQQIITHHGGTIGVASTAGVGSSFYFSVPLASASGVSNVK